MSRAFPADWLICLIGWRGMTQAEEFDVKALEMEVQMKAAVEAVSGRNSKVLNEVMCEHKDMGVDHFSHGLCRACYEEVNV